MLVTIPDVFSDQDMWIDMLEESNRLLKNYSVPNNYKVNIRPATNDEMQRIGVKPKDGEHISIILYESKSLVEVLISNFDPTDPFDTGTPEEFAMLWVRELLKANLSNEAVN